MGSNAAHIATIILAVMAVLAFIGTFITWLYKRGGQERSANDTQRAFGEALKENTKAMTGLTTELRDFREKTVLTLREHEWRLEAHDARLKIVEGNPRP